MQNSLADRPNPKISTWLLLGLILLGSALTAYLLLNRGHSWGDDFAGYLMQAQSLVRGDMDEFVRRNAFTIAESPITLGLTSYPWGLPLMLAPVYALFGMNFIAFKLVLTACYLGFLVSLFLLARTRLSDTGALLLTAFLAFNSYLLRAQNEIWPDLPFLLWSTLSLWLIERRTRSTSAPGIAEGLGLGLTIFMASFTRLNGLLLFVPLTAAQFDRLRSGSASTSRSRAALLRDAIPYGAFGVCYGLQALLLPSPPGGLEHAFEAFSALLVLHHAAYYFLVTGEFLKNSGVGGFVLYAILLIFFLVRVIARRRQDVPILLYSLGTLAFYSVFPPLVGPRFIYPILPVFFLLSFAGMQDAAARLASHLQDKAAHAIYLLWGVLALVSLLASGAAVRKNLAAGREAPDGPFLEAPSAMFSFVRRSTPMDSVIVFYKPRLMRLLTDRDSFLTMSCADLPRGDYAVIMPDTEGGPTYNQIPPSDITGCRSVSLTPVFERDGIVVYRIAPRF